MRRGSRTEACRRATTSSSRSTGRPSSLPSSRPSSLPGPRTSPSSSTSRRRGASTSSPASLRRFRVEQAITSVRLTSAWFQLLVGHDVQAFAGVQEVLTGGDVVSALHVQVLLQAYPGIRVVNGYGPTENTTFTTTYGVTD